MLAWSDLGLLLSLLLQRDLLSLEVTEEILLIKQPFAEGLVRFEEAGLGRIGLLVKKDLLFQILNHSHAVDVDLDLIPIALKHAENRNHVADLDVLLE